jgi:hypothetical protein
MSDWVREIGAAEIADADSFRSDVAANCEPVILRGICADWPATKAATHSWRLLSEYLTALDSGARAEAFVGPPSIDGRYFYSDDLNGFNFDRIEMALSDAMSRMDTTASDPHQPSVYFGSVSAEDHVPGFGEQNSLSIVPEPIRPRLWLGNKSFVSCHYDTFDNVACVVAGRRRFTLYRPESIGNLYVGPTEFTIAGPPVALAVDSAPGDPRYARFETIRDEALVADLQPGDALYLPKLWWHQVEATEPLNLLVNYWWDAFSGGPDAPYTTMMLAMIAIAERPSAERKAWRTFFDHYVFRPNGHPLAHLPPEKHGTLGPLKQNYGRIRARVMKTLREG